MRILFISQLFDPENSIKGLAFAQQLRSLGHEVEVVTTFPSYPGGKLFNGYKQRWKQLENIEGVEIVRLATFISHSQSILRRVLSYISFGIGASLYSLFGAKKPDVIYAYYPPVVVGLVALLVGKIRRVPYVYDVQDLWPEALVATRKVKRGRITNAIERVCTLIYRNAIQIVVLSEGYRRALISKKVPKEKITKIFNWCDEARLVCELRGSEIFDSGYFNVLYAGNLGAAQALVYVIEAAAILQESGNNRIRFNFIGAGVEENELKKKKDDLALSNVYFYPPVAVDRIGGILIQADALLVHLVDDPVFEITIPSKLQAYLMVGRPIIMAVNGEAACILDEAQAGIAVEPCQPDKLAKAVSELANLDRDSLRRYGEKGREYYNSKMSMKRGIGAVDSMLRDVV